MAADPESDAERSDASLQAFRDALSKSVTIPRERLQEIVDDAVRRGRLTRGDAEELVGRLVSRGREQAEDLLRQLEPIVEGVSSQVTKTAKRARDSANEPLAKADRIRRRARLPGFPITAYDQLSVPQINSRLRELTQEQLLKVREYESEHRNRVGIMRALERKLEKTPD